jgi:hypothetical protein
MCMCLHAKQRRGFGPASGVYQPTHAPTQGLQGLWRHSQAVLGCKGAVVLSASCTFLTGPPDLSD